jgi:predicted Zn finger-like uncharacterized protein
VSIRFACPTCKTQYTVNDRDAGKKAECKTCGQRVQVPAPVRSKTVLGDALPPDRPRPKVSQLPVARPSHIEQPKPEPEDDPTPVPIGYLPPIPKSYHLPKPVLLGCIGGGGLLILIGLGICLLSSFLGDGRLPLGAFSSDRDPELLAWVPQDTEVVVGFDLKELNQNAEFRELMKDEELSRVGDDGISISAVDKMIVTGRANKSSNLDTAIIFGLNKTYNPNTTPKHGTAKPKKKDGKTYLEFGSGRFFLFNPQANVVVIAEDETIMASSMSGTTGQVRISEDLRDTIRRSSGPIWAGAVGPAAQADTRGFFPSLYRFNKDPDPPPLVLSTFTSTRVRSDRTDFTITITYSSREKAKVACDQFNEGIRRTVADILAEKNPKDARIHLLRVIYDTNKFEASGSTVINTFQLPHRELKRLPKLLH